MLELKDRINKYTIPNDLEKMFRYLLLNKIPYDKVDFNSLFFQNELKPDKNLTREETLDLYKSFVAAASDHRYLPTSMYIPKDRNLYIRKFPRYMPEHPHVHRDALEIDFVLQGRFSQTIEGKRLEMTEGDMCLIAPNVRHTARIYTLNSVVLTIMVYQSVIKELLNSVEATKNLIRTFLMRVLYGSAFYPYLICRTEFDPDLAGMIMELEENQEENHPYINKYMEAGLRLILLRMLVKHEKHLKLSQEITKQESDILNIMDYIETNSADITLNSLARSYNYSPNYLSSLITNTYHRSFHEILTGIRMQKAVKLMMETDYSLSRIAEVVGYSDKSYFLKRFKQVFGMTPTQYKKQKKTTSDLGAT